MRLADYIDRAYIINLPTRPDRRRAVLSELDRIGLTEQTGKVKVFDAIRPADAGGFDSIGAHGCYMSHLAVLRDARDAGVKNLLVCEDDLTIIKRFGDYEESMLEQLRATPDWGIVFLGHQETVTGDGRLVTVPPEQHMLLLHMYLLNASVIDRLIAFLELLLTRPPGDPRGGPMHADGAVSIFRRRNPDVKTLRAEPILALQRASRSDIAGGKWWDHVPLLRSVAAFARELVTKVRHHKS
jgi:GR25 family glycosyltransferase involved in LPS biosynthesis